jgi:hypothetical protein
LPSFADSAQVCNKFFKLEIIRRLTMTGSQEG